MAYVGCIAGAISIEDYDRGLVEAGFAHVEVIDSGLDLKADDKVENQAACCPPAVLGVRPGRVRYRDESRWVRRRSWTKRCTPGGPTY